MRTNEEQERAERYLWSDPDVVQQGDGKVLANLEDWEPSEEKMPKSEVEFEHPAKGSDHCGDCVHFEDGGTCAIVDGAILAKDWCKEFKGGA